MYFWCICGEEVDLHILLLCHIKYLPYLDSLLGTCNKHWHINPVSIDWLYSDWVSGPKFGLVTLWGQHLPISHVREKQCGPSAGPGWFKGQGNTLSFCLPAKPSGQIQFFKYRLTSAQRSSFCLFGDGPGKELIGCLVFHLFGLGLLRFSFQVIQ